MTKILVLLTGMPGAGKSIFIHAARELGIPSLSMGDVVRQEAIRRGLKVAPDILAKLSIELRSKYGPDIIARRTITRIPEAPIIVIDGVRSMNEVNVFRSTSWKTVIVAIHSSPATRFKRLLRRGRPDDPKSWDEFRERDLRELKFGIGHVIALADVMLVNENIGKEEFKEQCKIALAKIIANEI